MIKLDEKDLELITKFIEFLGGEENQDTKRPYNIEGIELLKSVDDKIKEFKKIFKLYSIAYYENESPIDYAEFNKDSVFLELKNGYTFKNNNANSINLVIEKVNTQNE